MLIEENLGWQNWLDPDIVIDEEDVDPADGRFSVEGRRWEKWGVDAFYIRM